MKRTLWTRVSMAAAAGAVSLGTAAGQDSPSLAKVMQPPQYCNTCAASPLVAVAIVRDGEAQAIAARASAVDVVAAYTWQADRECEDALVYALRRDPSEKVRFQAASALGAAKYLTPRTLDALQCCAVGSSRDGFAGERDLAVKAEAKASLQKHPTSGNPERIAALQRETALGRRGAPTLGSPRFRGEEEASPPDKLPDRLPESPSAVLGAPVPTNLPPPATSSTKSPATSSGPLTLPPLSVSTPPPSSKTLPLLPAQTAATLPPAAPVKATMPQPFQVSAPMPLPLAPKTEERLPEKIATTLPPAIDEKPMSLRERRIELREMGLSDPTMRLFTQQIGAPPPAKVTMASEPSNIVQTSASVAAPAPAAVAQPQSRGVWSRLFGSRSGAPSEQTPSSVESTGIPPLSTSPSLRAP